MFVEWLIVEQEAKELLRDDDLEELCGLNLLAFHNLTHYHFPQVVIF